MAKARRSAARPPTFYSRTAENPRAPKGSGKTIVLASHGSPRVSGTAGSLLDPGFGDRYRRGAGASENPEDPRREYDAALAAYRIVAAKDSEAAKQYRDRKIGDAAFLQVRAEFTAAQKAFDAAEAKYVAAVDAQGEPPPPSDRQQGFGFSENPAPSDPGEMTASQINKALEKLDQKGNALSQKMIDEGRGHERPSDYLSKTDPLSTALRENYEARMTLRHEVERRMGPGPARFPHDWLRGKFNRPRVRPGVDAAENPLDTSIDGWTRWHGDPPNEVGNLGPGQQIQTADGWWYRQDGGVDAGKLFFQATPGGPAMLGPEPAGLFAYPDVFVPSQIESLEYLTEAAGPAEVELFPSIDQPEFMSPEQVEIEAVENPTPEFEAAKAKRDRLEQEVKAAGDVLGTFPSGPTGLTPDHVRAMPEWRAAKARYQTAFTALQNFQHCLHEDVREGAARRARRPPLGLARCA